MAIEVFFGGGKKVNAVIKGFTVSTDQPVESGGDATAPTPFDLFQASLGTCIGIYAKSFCDQRQIPSEEIFITLENKYDPIQKMIVKFITHIHVPQDFPTQYEQALIKTVGLCAVKRHLKPEIESEIIIIRMSK